VDTHALLARLDRYQQRHRIPGFVVAVIKKFSEDQGGYLAAVISYYGFFSLFPLLLVMTTILGYVLHGHPKVEQTLIDSALAQFPVIGPELKTGHLTGSSTALVIGIVVALWAGIGVFLAGQAAMNTVWGIPFRKRPSFVGQRLRALGLLGLLGGLVLGTAILSGLGTFGARYGEVWKLGSLLLALGLNFVLLWGAFRFLTSDDVSWSALRGGAIVAAIAYQVLEALGGYYVGHVVKGAGNTYGTFALVIGLLAWIYLAAQILLYTAEGNVVATRQLHPRSLFGDGPPTDADRRALRQRAQVEERRDDERIEVGYGSRR